MTPSDMNIDYKVSLFLHLHNDLLYYSLSFTCTSLYLIEGTIVFQSASVDAYQCHHWKSEMASTDVDGVAGIS